MTYKLSQLAQLPGFTWHGPQPVWGFDREGLFIQPAGGTDFWQRTHYGFSADNGHFLKPVAPTSGSAPTMGSRRTMDTSCSRDSLAILSFAPPCIRNRATNTIRPG